MALKRFAIAALFTLIAVNLASAGIIRNVVKPVVKTSAHVVVKTVKVAAKIAY